MNIKQAIDTMITKGYCLWVGAGIDIYITNRGSPSWEDLTKRLENRLADAQKAQSLSLPERIGAFAAVHGREALIQKVRSELVEPVHKALLLKFDAMKANCPWVFEPSPSLQWPPAMGMPENLDQKSIDSYNDETKIFRTLAKLGRYANPIVNFNLTQEVSHLLREPTAPMRLCCGDHRFLSEDAYHDSTSLIYQARMPGLDVIHPHGLLRDKGDSCILTSDDYKGVQSGTGDALLAFRVATADAYQKHLAIVGMSLEDRYLCEQINDFRDEIRDIFWFQTPSGPKDPIVPVRDIKRVEVASWMDFWETVDDAIEHFSAEEIPRFHWSIQNMERAVSLTRP